MKKSSLLHNPKDMLSRSFKPAKCKTALKLATSRMKLLKNKKDVQLKQMKRELAQLLEAGQDQTARIRVEHVIREEKMMAAYELLDIYCELIVARLPIIESQKECPIDLKEAITSVIFASPRCGDVPELLDARKLLSAKYGKEFVNAAIELRPNSGVSRLLVEKLSANAPDGQTKKKTLTKIAEEHNIKWDPDSFGQNGEVPPNDLLYGAKTFEASTVVHEAPPVPNFQAPPSHNKMDNQPMNFSQENVRSSPGRHEFDAGQNNFSRNTTSSIPQAQMKPSGVWQEKGPVSESFQREGTQGSSSFSGESWNMEFKDAHSAAQAAAESAERASMAARAAAELSSRATFQAATKPQHSSEVHDSISNYSRDERPGKQATSRHASEYVSQGSVKSSSDRQPRFQNNPSDMIERENRERSSKRSSKDGHDTGNGYGHVTNSRPQASVQDETFTHSFQVPDGPSQKSSPRKEGINTQSSTRRQSGKIETEDINHLQEGFGSENYAYSGDMIRKQSSRRSSSSHSNASGSDDELSNYGHQMFVDYDAGKGPFVDKDEEFNARDPLASSKNSADAPVVFDDSGSDGEDIWSAPGLKFNEEPNMHFASPSRSSPARSLHRNSSNEKRTHTSGGSPVGAVSESSPKKHSFAEFSESVESSADRSQADNLGPVTFDDSDGSESNADVLRSKQGLFKDVGRRNPSLEFSDAEIHRNYLRLRMSQEENNAGIDDDDDDEHLPSSQSKASLAHESKDNTSSPHHLRADDENSDDGKELNFNKLTGGFRHKGYFRPPYTRPQVDDNTDSPRKVSDESPPTVRQTPAASTAGKSTNTGKGKLVGNNGKTSRVPDDDSDSDFDSDGDSSIEEVQQQSTRLRQKPEDIQDGRKDVKVPSSLRSSSTYFHYMSSDSEDDSAVQVATGKTHPGSGFSRRTKPSPSVPNQKASSRSQALRNDSGSSETPQEPLSRNRNSDQRPKSEQQTSSGRLASKASFPEETKKSSVERRSSRSQALRKDSGSSETPQEPLSRNRNSDQRPKPEQRTSSGRVTSKASLAEETERSSSATNQKAAGSRSQALRNDYGSSETPRDQRPKSEQQTSSGRVASKASLPEETEKSSSVPNQKAGSRSQALRNDYGSSETPRDQRPKSEQHTSSGRVASKASLPEETEKSPVERKVEKSENEKATSTTTIGREDSSKKPSHVHPKLPEFDTLAARIQAFSKERQ